MGFIPLTRHPDHEFRKHRHGGAFSLIIRVFDKLGGGVEGRMVAFLAESLQHLMNSKSYNSRIGIA